MGGPQGAGLRRDADRGGRRGVDRAARRRAARRRHPAVAAPAPTPSKASAADTARANEKCEESDALYTDGKADAALRAALAAIQLDGALADAHRCAGRALFALGRVEMAERSWKRAIELSAPAPTPAATADAADTPDAPAPSCEPSSAPAKPAGAEVTLPTAEAPPEPAPAGADEAAPVPEATEPPPSAAAAAAGAPAGEAPTDAAPARAPHVYAPYASRRTSRVPSHWVDKYERDAAKNWDLFYRRHADHFFKDRHYLEAEWPELRGGGGDDGGDAADAAGDGGDAADDSAAVGELLQADGSEVRLLEAGCGVGNTLFPLLRSNPRLVAYGFDFSPAAIEIVRRHPLAREGRVISAVGDLTSGRLPEELADACGGACDVATLMFVLSAITPDKMAAAIDAAAAGLRVGGRLLIRDYADGDGAQERLRHAAQPKQLDEAGRFFVRQDGTRAYYFGESELTRLVEGRGFETVRCEVTHRETVNRLKGLAIARRYVTATFRLVSRTPPAEATGGAGSGGGGGGGGDGSVQSAAAGPSKTTPRAAAVPAPGPAPPTKPRTPPQAARAEGSASKSDKKPAATAPPVQGEEEEAARARGHVASWGAYRHDGRAASSARGLPRAAQARGRRPRRNHRRRRGRAAAAATAATRSAASLADELARRIFIDVMYTQLYSVQ